MLRTRIIPCLDVRDGRVVKGVRFQNLRDSGDPAERAEEYERQGGDELVMLDVSATPRGRSTALETVRQIRGVMALPLTVGGGVRTLADAGALLEAGADKVAANTAAVQRPALLTDMASRFGRQCTVVAIDAQRSPRGDRWQVVIRSGTDTRPLDAVEWAREAAGRGAGEILLTSWDRDGTQEGYDLELLASVTRSVDIPVIASGGAAHARHLIEAVRAGASAVLAASIFHDGHTTVASVKEELAAAGVTIRPVERVE